MKTHKLGSAPITDNEYAELLGNIGKLSEKDRKALRARARAYELPAALSAAENALRSVFRPLFDLAWSLSAKQIVPYTTDEQVAAERAWSPALTTHGDNGVSSIRLSGTANQRRLRFRRARPDAGPKLCSPCQLRRGQWMSDIFLLAVALWLGAGSSGDVRGAGNASLG